MDSLFSQREMSLLLNAYAINESLKSPEIGATLTKLNVDAKTGSPDAHRLRGCDPTSHIREVG